MARQTHSAFARELAQYDARLEQAFLEAVQNITSGAQLRALDSAIAANDAQAVIELLDLTPAAWAGVDREIVGAFIAGGLWQAAALSGRRLPRQAGQPTAPVLRLGFNQRNPRAEEWTRNRAAQRVTEMTSDGQASIRSVMREAVEQGWGVQRTRRILVGTQRGNQMTGGIVGLHSNDVDAVIRARAELNDPATLRAYLRRMDNAAPGRATVRAAIRADRPMTQPEIDRVVQAYSNRLLRVRGQRIARTEAHNAFTAGADESIRQAVDSGQVPASAVTMEWQSTVASKRTRDSHRSMNGQRVAYGQPFVSPTTGARMMYPGDTSLGAPASETINCRCSARPVVDFVSMAR